jgi:hypothetical protein
MTPRHPPSAEHFTQVVTEVDRLVQQGCAEISALSRMALLWLETPETSPPYACACVGPPAGLQSCRRTGLLRHLTRRDCLNVARRAK